MIQHYLPLAKRLAENCANEVRLSSKFDIDEDELVSVGIWEGLVLNLDVYDPSVGTNISTFFGQQISFRIIDNKRKQDWVPRSERSAYRAQYEAMADFQRVNGRPPTGAEELHSFRGKTGEPEPLRMHSPFHISMDATRAERMGSNGQEKSDLSTLHDVLVRDDDNEGNLEFLREMMGTFEGRRGKILHHIYREGLTMKETGAELGLSESSISIQHAQIIVDLKRRMQASLHQIGEAIA